MSTKELRKEFMEQSILALENFIANPNVQNWKKFDKARTIIPGCGIRLVLDGGGLCYTCPYSHTKRGRMLCTSDFWNAMTQDELDHDGYILTGL